MKPKVIFIIFILFPLCTSSLLAEKVVLHLKWYHQFQFAGYYMAKEKGYYEEEGLDVQFVSGPGRGRIVSNVLSEDLHFGISDANLVLDRSKGKDVVALAALFQNSPFIMMSKKGSGIKTVHDFPGKRVGVKKGDVGVQFFTLINKEGLSESSMNFVEPDWSLKRFISGEIEIMPGYSTLQPYYLKNMGIEVNSISPLDYGIFFYGDILFTSGKSIKKGREAVEGFVEASMKGWSYALSNTSESADLILSMPGVKERGIDKETLLYEARQMRRLMHPEVTPIGHMSIERWKMIASYVDKYHEEENVLVDEDFIYVKGKDALSWELIFLLALLAFAALCAGVILFVWNWSLKKNIQEKAYELKLSEAKFKDMFEQNSGMLFIFNPQNKIILDANDSTAGFLAYEREELINERLDELNLIDGHELDKVINSCSEHKLVHTKLRKKDGKACDVEINASMIESDTNRNMVFCIITDISMRLEAQELVKKESDRAELYFDISGVILTVLDSNGIVRLINRKGAEMLGMPKADIIGKNWIDIAIKEGERDKVHTVLAKLADKEISANDFEERVVEHTIISASGAEYIIKWTNRLIFNENDGLEAIISSGEDVTDTKKAEELLLKYMKTLEHRNKELYDFAYIISHDLKEPLRGIKNYSKLLYVENADKLDEQAKSDLENLSRQANRMEQFINSLLQYSRVGRKEPEKKDVDLNLLVSDVKDALRSMINENGVELSIDNELPVIQCDETMCFEVLQNLISNAVKYNDKDKKIINIGTNKENIIYIKDNGIGIEDEHKEDVFTIFRRLHPSDSFGGGSGAGLTIVKKIIERHDGRIWIESAQGEGTTFFFSFG